MEMFDDDCGPTMASVLMSTAALGAACLIGYACGTSGQRRRALLKDHDGELRKRIDDDGEKVRAFFFLARFDQRRTRGAFERMFFLLLCSPFRLYRVPFSIRRHLSTRIRHVLTCRPTTRFVSTTTGRRRIVHAEKHVLLFEKSV